MAFNMQSICQSLFYKLKSAVSLTETDSSKDGQPTFEAICSSSKIKQIIGTITLILWAICSLIMSLLLFAAASIVAVYATTAMLVYKSAKKKYPQWWLKD